MSVTITRDEWLAEIERVMASSNGSDGLTCAEISEALGWTPDHTREALRKLHKANRLVAGNGERMSIGGRRAVVPVYRIV